MRVSEMSCGSIRIRRNDLSASPGREGPPGDEIDRIFDKPHAPIAQQGEHSARMRTAGPQPADPMSENVGNLAVGCLVGIEINDRLGPEDPRDSAVASPGTRAR